MIDPILFGIAILLLGFGACAFFAGTATRNLSCPCGMKWLRNACMTHSSDEATIIARLTALCPVCSCNARHNHVDAGAQGVALGDVLSPEDTR